jgi:NADPH:quinone reductase
MLTRSCIGHYVLVHGAGGGVGLAAVTIAKALGMYVIAYADTARKREVAKSFGAHFVVDRTVDWAEQARSRTPDNRGVDVVLDTLGVIDRSLKCIRWGGRLVVIGFAARVIEKIPTNRILLKIVSLSGLFWGMYATMEPDTVAEVWNTLLALIEQGEIKSFNYTEREFHGLESIPAALELLSTGIVWGKIVIDVSEHGKAEM